MFEKILVPLDGSELAELALPYAEEIAGRFDSELTLLHVRQSAEDPYHHMYQAYFEKVAENTRCGIEECLWRDEKKAINIDTKMLVGRPAEQIVDCADSQDNTLVIMATHGHSGVRRWALGSVAEKVIRGTKQPVLLIRAGNPRSKVFMKSMLKKVLVPLDGSEASEAIIPYVEELTNRLNSELFLLIVQEMSFYISPEYAAYSNESFESMEAAAKGYLNKLSTQLSLKGISTKCDVRMGIVAEKILAFANEVDADIIAMTTHGRSRIGCWVLGSVALHILHEGTLPLLLVKV